VDSQSWTEAWLSSTWVIVEIVFMVLVIAGTWKIFVKAGRPGWGAIIPFYNTYLMLKVAGRPGWWLILFFMPFVNIVIWLIVALGISENFGHGPGMASFCGCSHRSCPWCSASAVRSTGPSGREDAVS
jgi:hypothetical protein